MKNRNRTRNRATDVAPVPTDVAPVPTDVAPVPTDVAPTDVAPTDVAPYDPTAPVDGATDVVAAIAAAAIAIAAARTPIPATVIFPGARPRWNAPGIPAGLPPVGTMIQTPYGAAEIRHWASRIEYDNAPRWGNLSASMITIIDPGVVPGDHGIIPIGTRVRSSRGRMGTTREIFAVVRDSAGNLHNVSSARITGARPAAGPHGATMTPVIVAPSPIIV